MKKRATPYKKHVPERTCIACRAKRPKRDLVRIVHHTEDGVMVDEMGKSKGRGAYLCRQSVCWNHALRRGALQRALRVTLTPEEIAAVETYAQSLPKTLAVDETIQEE